MSKTTDQKDKKRRVTLATVKVNDRDVRIAEMCHHLIDSKDKEDFIKAMIEVYIQPDLVNPNNNYHRQGRVSMLREILNNKKIYQQLDKEGRL